MDCFYAAVEIRDNPDLAGKPVAVGASPAQRGVLCTCNYIAREYGVRSAMPTSRAYRLCPQLIVLPVDMKKYRKVAESIHRIFREYTDLVEPLALDEAYLDVTYSEHYQGSATLIAQAIRADILNSEGLTASAGVAPNKFLAKIASGWKKPNGLYVIRPQEIDNFIRNLAVEELYGVGKVTAEKLHHLGFKNCLDLQKISLVALTEQFGKLGRQLYDQCRGIDHRSVQPNRERKSLSVETTFPQDIPDLINCNEIILNLFVRLQQRMHADAVANRRIKNQFIKIKFNDFKQVTAELMTEEINLKHFQSLLQEAFDREKKPIRLIGMGVHYQSAKTSLAAIQQSLF